MNDPNLPQTGGAQSLNISTEKAPVGAGDGLFDGIEAPKVQQQEAVSLEGIGDISEGPKQDTIPAEGVGQHVVILSDVVSGPMGGFTRGMVTRISNLVPGFTDKDRDEEAVKAECRRLLHNKAIRIATSEEAQHTFVDLSPQSETPHVAEERNRRIASDKRVQELEAEIRKMKGEDQIAPVPGTGNGEKV
jgi:hypothetical protein